MIREELLMFAIWNDERQAFLALPTAEKTYTSIFEDARVFLTMKQANACIEEGDEVVKIDGAMPMDHLVTHASNSPRRTLLAIMGQMATTLGLKSNI